MTKSNQVRNHIIAVVATLVFDGGVSLVRAQSVPTPAQGTARPTTRPSLPHRIFIDVNGGFQSGAETFSDHRSDPFFGETASWNADYETRSAPAFGLSGGVRIWRNLGAAAAYSHFSDTNIAVIRGGVPHPFFFNTTREFSGETVGLTQQDDAVHAGPMWSLPVSRWFDVRVFGGPSWYRVQRDLVADVDHQEDGYPYDTASFGSARVERVKVSALGFHVGGDATVMFTRTVGVGVTVRFSRAETDAVSPANGDSLALRLGGMQFGGGLRFRFGSVARRREPASRPTGVEADQSSPHEETSPAPESADQVPPDTAVLKIDAPIFVRPDALAPLRVLTKGTPVRVREQDGKWLMIEFRDPQWGTRVGYVLRENVALR